MIDWQNIDTVLLDMDGTLLDLHFDNYFWFEHLPRRYAEFHQMEFRRAEEELTALIRKYEGTLQWYCLDHWSELIRMDMASLKHEIRHMIQLRPHSEIFLKYLRQLRKKVVLTTNAHRGGLSIKLDVTRIDRWLDLVISSHDYQQPKEQLAFWHCLATAESFDPARTLFIDDNASVLRTAHAYGIRHLICITQPDSRRQGLASGEFLDIADFDEIMPADVRATITD